jgi:UDP-N-acetylglucosamine 2-epimerase (non-hydrolysing)
MREFGFNETVASSLNNLMLIEPLGYLDFLWLEINARFVLTDSGGIQEETTFFNVPCLTLRENTERPITVTQGTNTLVAIDYNRIVKESLNILNGQWKKGTVPKFWDDKVTSRIVEVLRR